MQNNILIKYPLLIMVPFSSSLCRLRDMLVLTMRIFQSKVILLIVYKTKWHTVYIRISLCTYNQLEIYFLVQWKQGRVLSSHQIFWAVLNHLIWSCQVLGFFPQWNKLVLFHWFFFFCLSYRWIKVLLLIWVRKKPIHTLFPCFCFKQAMEEKRKGKA